MKRWLTRLGLVLTPLSLLFVGLAGVEVVNRLARGSLNLSWAPLTLSLLCQALGYLALAWGFARFLASYVTPAPGFRASAELYYRSLLARYLPGKVGLPTVRVAGAASVHAAPSVMLASVAFEGLTWLGTGGFLALATMGLLRQYTELLPGLSGSMAWFLLGAALSGLVLLSVLDRRRYPALVLRFVPDSPLTGPLVPRSLVVANGLTQALQAGSCALIALSLGGSRDSAYMAAFAGLASSLAGFLALPVPAGMGVREGVMVLILGPSLGSEAALAVALIARASSLVLECAAWLIALSLHVGPLRQRNACES